MSHLSLNSVTKRYGKIEVVSAASLNIEVGEFVVFVGPSGCGKSTLLRMIAGLEDISEGQIEIDGKVVNALPPVKRGIAMVFQSYALYPHMTVYENIAFPLRVSREPQAQIDRRVRAAAEILQLAERLEHRPAELSGGQRQRVAIGRAIVREPKVFLFDEPLSNLDAALRADMRLELSRLHSQLGNTMIYVTHDQVEAMTMADRIVVLNAGRIEQTGSPLELYHYPRNIFVAGFLGTPRINLLPAKAMSRDDRMLTLRLSDGTLIEAAVAGPVAAGEPLTLGIRPDDLVPDANGPFALVPEVIERLGSSTICHGFFGQTLPISMVTNGSSAIRPRTMIRARVAPSACHVFRADGTAMPRDRMDEGQQ